MKFMAVAPPHGAFSSGARQQDQMSIIAQELSDADMANVAAWYLSLKVTVTMPQ
jgi:cytochrome c553